MSTAFHPHTDGETERVNHVLEDMLRMYVNEKQTNWTEFLSLAEFAYNCSWHSSIQMTPFEAIYGQNCYTPVNFADPQNRVEVSKQMLERMDEEVKLIQKSIQRAQDMQKHYYDKKCSFREFQIGEMVFLKVIPKRSNLILGKDRRLSPRFAGPFKILKRVGTLAYQLELPENIKVHPVFHVCLLKSYVANPSHILQDKSRIMEDGTLKVEPQYILDRNTKRLRNRTIEEVLVKWDAYPVEDASWVDLDALLTEFPSFKL